MARAPFRPVELSEALRPVASPVDSFIHAQDPPRDNNLQDLARSLSGLGGSLAGLVGARDKKAEEDAATRGEAAAWQDYATGAAKGVAQGLIPAQGDPNFMRAYRKAQGDIAGGTLEQQFAAAYNSWEGKSSADPAAYDAFLGNFLRDKFGNTDPDFLRGYLPKLRQFTHNYQQQHIGDASKATMQGAIQASAAKDNQTLEGANSAGISSRQGTDYAGAFSEIERNREASLKTGMNREQYDKQVVDGITANAVKLRDPKILDFLNRKVPGQDYSWGNTPYGRDERQKAMDSLETMGRRAIGDDEKKRREEKAAAKDDITRRTIQAITAKPNEPIPEDLLAAGEKVDADFRVNAIRWRDTIGKGTQASDNEELTHVTRQILFEGGGVQAVQRAMDRGVFKNPEDLTRAYKLAEGMKEHGPAIQAIFSSDQSKAIERSIRERTLTQNDTTKVFDPDGMSDTGLAAKRDYRLALLTWRQANPDADFIAQEKAIGEIGAAILGRLATDPGGGATYDREGIPASNPFVRAPANPEEGAVPQPKPAPAPAKPAQPTFGDFGGQVPGELSVPADSTVPPAPSQPVPPKTEAPLATTPSTTASPAASGPADAAAWFNAEPPETRALLERRAAEEKKPLSLKVQEAYERGISTGRVALPPPVPGASGKRSERRAPDGTPIETASLTGADGKADTMRAFDRVAPDSQDGTPSPDAVRMVSEAFERAIARTSAPQGGYATASLKDDPKAARILDFVAGPESRGNYNAYFGHADSTRDLSAMTLDGVMSWSANRGTASSATGRYQFMRDTLSSLKQEMGLSGSERFTPELQDKMALQLLNRRGYQDWAAGRISTAQFGNNLALEWAALPNLIPQRGRGVGQSAYEGDGLNRSLVTPQAVRSMLEGTGAMPATALADASRNGQQRPGIASMIASLFRRKAPSNGSSLASDGPGGVYGAIPDVDGGGRPGQKAKFLEWNPDPVGNNEKYLKQVHPELAAVIRKAQADNPGLRFVVASGQRDEALQKKAVEWGWSKTSDSHHQHGNAADIWVLNDKGQVVFDQKLQEQAAAAVKKAAGQLGTGVRWGGDFKTFKDRPHFELAGTRRA